MQGKCVFLIPLFVLMTICALLAGSIGNDKKILQTNPAPNESLINANISNHTVNHIHWKYMKLYSEDFQPSLSTIIDSVSLKSSTMGLNKNVVSGHLARFHPTEIDRYMDVYKNGGFSFPITFGGSKSFYDQDVIDSWEYQKNIMYPYGQNPNDFYRP
jgi:hypothetical protein